jgi:predicted house-cleaning noncanonical NTP pyrophosphatase (MazG superfamily)
MKKLVRDRIPDILRAQGKQEGKDFSVSMVEGDAYRQTLVKKPDEEVAEFKRRHDGEELADILEVLYALAALDGVSPPQLEERRRKKAEERGGFSKRLIQEM